MAELGRGANGVRSPGTKGEGEDGGGGKSGSGTRAPGRVVGGFLLRWVAEPAEVVGALLGRMLIYGVLWAAGPFH
jgi:hypothetical protein